MILQAANARHDATRQRGELHLTRIAPSGRQHSELRDGEHLDVRYADGAIWAVFGWSRRGLTLVAMDAETEAPPMLSADPRGADTRPMQVGETVGRGRLVRLGDDWIRVA